LPGPGLPGTVAGVTAVVFALLGVGAGAGARLLVRRLPRGAPVRPPWCEVALGLSWAACGWCWSIGRLSGHWLPLLFGLGWLAVAAGAVDLMRHRLPDALTMPALPLALLLVAPLGPACTVRAVAGGAVLFGAHLVVRMVAPAAMGAGDVKLAAPLGAALGAVSWRAVVLWAVLAAALTTVAALGHRATRAHTVGPGVPHGPSMLVAGWLVVAAAAVGAAGATG
jgi:leader peptidase (prepilin peptidase)/N-methyltransferase